MEISKLAISTVGDVKSVKMPLQQRKGDVNTVKERDSAHYLDISYRLDSRTSFST